MRRTGNPLASWVLAFVLGAVAILWPAATPPAGAQTSTPAGGETVSGPKPQQTPTTVIVWRGEVLGSYPEGTVLSFPFGYESLPAGAKVVVLGLTSQPWLDPKGTVYYVPEEVSGEFTDCHTADWATVCVSPEPWFGGLSEIMQVVPNMPGFWYNISYTTGRSWWPRIAMTNDGRPALTWSDSTSTSDPTNSDVYIGELAPYPGGIAWNHPLQSSRGGSHPNVVANGTTANAYFTADWDSGDLPGLFIRFAVTDTLSSPCSGLPYAFAWDPSIYGPATVTVGQPVTYTVQLRNSNATITTGAAVTITDSMTGTWVGDCGVDVPCQVHDTLVELDELRPETEALVSFVGEGLEPGQHKLTLCNNSFCQTKSLQVLREDQQVTHIWAPLVLWGWQGGGASAATAITPPTLPRCKIFYREVSQPQLCR